MRRQQPRQVGDIFSQDLFAIHAKIGKWAVAVELRHQFLCCRVVVGEIFGRPPIAEPALGVVNIAQLVEAVADFVSHARSGGSVVRSCVTLAIEDRAAARGRLKTFQYLG